MYKPSLVSLNNNWVNGGAITFKCRKKSDGTLGTAPTKGAIVIDAFRYKRLGDTMFFKVEYKQSTAGVTGGGTSYLYVLDITGGLSIDITKFPVFGGGAISDGTLGNNARFVCGHGAGQTQSGSDLNPITMPFAYSATELGVIVGNNALWDADSGFDFPDANASITLLGMIPISGWS